MPGVVLHFANRTWPRRRPLPSLPLEIWDRIVTHLTPLDIRHLGSINKLFNRRYWDPESTMYRVPLSAVEEGDLEWAKWVFLESRSRLALLYRMALPDVREQSYLPGPPAAYQHLAKLEFEVFLGGFVPWQGFDPLTFIRDVCSYHRVAPNLRELRIHVDVRARDLSQLLRGNGPEQDKDWIVSRRTSLLRDDVGLPDQRITTVIFHHLAAEMVSEGSVIGTQISQLLYCLPADTVALATAPLTPSPATTAARGGTVMEKLITAFVPTLESLDRIQPEALKSLTSLILRRASSSCARQVLQYRYPRLVTLGLPLPRTLFQHYIEGAVSADDDKIRVDMIATATHRGLSRLLLVQETLFLWHVLYHLKQARQFRVNDETSLASWPHDFVNQSMGMPSEEFPREEDFEWSLLRGFADEKRREGRKRGRSVTKATSRSSSSKRNKKG